MPSASCPSLAAEPPIETATGPSVPTLSLPPRSRPSRPEALVRRAAPVSDWLRPHPAPIRAVPFEPLRPQVGQWDPFLPLPDLLNGLPEPARQARRLTRRRHREGPAPEARHDCPAPICRARPSVRPVPPPQRPAEPSRPLEPSLVAACAPTCSGVPRQSQPGGSQVSLVTSQATGKKRRETRRGNRDNVQGRLDRARVRRILSRRHCKRVSSRSCYQLHPSLFAALGASSRLAILRIRATSGFRVVFARGPSTARSDCAPACHGTPPPPGSASDSGRVQMRVETTPVLAGGPHAASPATAPIMTTPAQVSSVRPRQVQTPHQSAWKPMPLAEQRGMAPYTEPIPLGDAQRSRRPSAGHLPKAG